MTEPLVSVIIPSRNSAHTITRCLNSIVNQSYKNIEIIIIDNHSEDDTLNISKKYANKIYSIGPERSHQINYGVKNAIGKYIYRVDSDLVLDPNVIEEAVDLSESNNYAAIIVHYTPDPTISFWSRVREFEHNMYSSDYLHVPARFMRKDVFISLGGFDEKLIAGEDHDLHNRIMDKYLIGKISSKEKHIGEYKSIKQIALKQYYYSQSLCIFLLKNKGRGIKQMSPFRIAYLKNIRKFIIHPDLAIGFIIYQFIRYFFSALGMIVNGFRIKIN
jgi:glycosyltransferase involved in cell wall biosynthesis